ATPLAKAESRPGPVGEGPLSFADWLQDPEAAKQQAAKQNKDLLVFFSGSDWDLPSRKLARDVLLTPEVRHKAAESFVCVLVDFPKNKPARDRVQDAGRNEQLKKRYRVEGLPEVVLADGEGRPYAFLGYEEGEPADYYRHLLDLQKVRQRRDE